MYKLLFYFNYLVVDECLRRGDVCPNGRCVNVPNGYLCLCNPGYVLGRDNKCLGKSVLKKKLPRHAPRTNQF